MTKTKIPTFDTPPGPEPGEARTEEEARAEAFQRMTREEQQAKAKKALADDCAQMRKYRTPKEGWKAHGDERDYDALSDYASGVADDLMLHGYDFHDVVYELEYQAEYMREMRDDPNSRYGAWARASDEYKTPEERAAFANSLFDSGEVVSLLHRGGRISTTEHDSGADLRAALTEVLQSGPDLFVIGVNQFGGKGWTLRSWCKPPTEATAA